MLHDHTYFHRIEVGQAPGGYTVAIDRAAFERIIEETVARVPAESAGLLLGHEARREGAGAIKVESAAPVSLAPCGTGLQPDAAEVAARAGGARPDGEVVLGWFFADPGLGIFPPRLCSQVAMEGFGPGASVVLVVNPASRQGFFFAPDRERFAPVGGLALRWRDSGNEALAEPLEGELPGAARWLDERRPETQLLAQPSVRTDGEATAVVPPPEEAVRWPATSPIAPSAGASPGHPGTESPAAPAPVGRDLWTIDEEAGSAPLCRERPHRSVSSRARSGRAIALGLAVMLVLAALGAAALIWGPPSSGDTGAASGAAAAAPVASQTATAPPAAGVAAPQERPTATSTPSAVSTPSPVPPTATATIMPSPTATPLPVLRGYVIGAYYTVERGDSLSVIALRYDTTPLAIIRANGLASTIISPGQVLAIPAGSLPAATPIP